MKDAARRSKTLFVLLLAVAACLQALLRWRADRARGSPVAVNTQQALYVSSGRSLKRLSLGFNGLLADIYWTRAIQYFGNTRLDRNVNFDLLGPLLRVTTTLDPHLLTAYRFGAIFLAEKPPGGAGRPEEAMQLLRRGIVANPDYWRLWEDLGFIEYWDLHDYAAAARIFKAGSERPGAEIWMKTLAATVAAKGGEARTSRALWTEVYTTARNAMVKQSALAHLAALKTSQELKELDRILSLYRKRTGRPASTFNDLVSTGLLPGIPHDPSGAPFILSPAGTAALGPQSKIDLRLIG